MALIDDVVVSWRLNDDAANTTVLDGEASNNGILTGGNNTEDLSVAGIIDKGLDFDGTNDFVISTNDTGITGSQNRSISFWAKTTTTVVDSGFVTLESGSGSGTRFELVIKSSTVIQLIASGGNRQWQPTNFSDGNWHHYVIILDGNSTNDLSLWFDGSLETPTSTTDVVFNVPDGKFYVGSGDLVNAFDGIITEALLFNVAVTSANVSSLWNSGSGFAYPFAAGTNMQLNIADAWKSVDGMQINIGDSWKPVAGAQVNIGDAWKTIF